MATPKVTILDNSKERDHFAAVYELDERELQWRLLVVWLKAKYEQVVPCDTQFSPEYRDGWRECCLGIVRDLYGEEEWAKFIECDTPKECRGSGG